MLALDFILVILTTACVIYCMILNKRIIQIQKYKSEMTKIFNDFDKMVLKTENILASTMDIIPRSNENIEAYQKKSKIIQDELDFIVEKADKLAEELETIIISGNKLSTRLNDQLNSATLESEENSIVQKTYISADQKENTEKIKLSQMDYYEIIQNKKRRAI